MKKRIVSAIVALLIFVPLLLMGGSYYTILIFLLSIQGVKEIIAAFNTKKEIPLFIQFISYLVMSYFILTASEIDALPLTLDFRLLIGIIILYMIPVIIYQNDKTYGIIDAFTMIGCILLLGISFSLLIIIRNINLIWIIYLLLITIFTDTYALIAGKLIGKHKCTPKISPNKTWEGAIIGTIIGVFTAIVYITTVTTLNIPLSFIIIMTLFLSIIGQFGDLIFSAIKRYFKIKDFSNFMPGHGGILDRFDSIFLVMLAFTFFINIL